MTTHTSDSGFILVVHDDPETAEALRELLSYIPLEVVVRESSEGAQRLLEEDERWRNCLGAVIDVGLPEGTAAGPILAEWIRQRERSKAGEGVSRKRLVGVTSHEARALHLENGAFDVGLQWPYAPARLLRALAGEEERRGDASTGCR